MSTDDARRPTAQELHDLRTVEITYAVLSAAAAVGAVALVGWAVGMPASSTWSRWYPALLTVVGAVATARAVRALWRFEQRVRSPIPDVRDAEVPDTPP